MLITCIFIVTAMKVQVKQILTHTPPGPSSPVVAWSFKTGFPCAGFSSVFTLSLNWAADIPQTVANTAKSVALRVKKEKKQMHSIYVTFDIVMCHVESRRTEVS